MKKFLFPLVVACALALPGVSHANKDKGGKCGNKGMMKKHELSMQHKVFHKGHFFLAHAKQIGLSNEQIEKIRSIKVDFKKRLIKDEAEVDTLKVDIRAALYAETPDQAKINSLIDKKYEVKKGSSKAAVAALLELKEVLTPEQKEKAKALWGEKKSGKCFKK